MTIKAFAFEAHRRVGTQLGASFRRSHVYESLAAAFGYASYASFSAHSVFDAASSGSPQPSQATARVGQRLLQLGFPESKAVQAAAELLACVSEHGLRAVDLDQVIDSLRLEDGDDDDWLDSNANHGLSSVSDADGSPEWFPAAGVSDFLQSGLEESASRGNASAHYALSLLLRTEGEPLGSSYWHDRQEQGEQLYGAQLEWANAFRSAREDKAARVNHLREAARLGHPDACVDAAEEFDDPSFLRAIGDGRVRNPVRASEVAAEMGSIDQAKRWCEAAAEKGDIRAISLMVERYDQADLLRRWTWVYFAQSLGTDLTENKCFLINEDGSDYDDDVGGPGFPIESEGIQLESIDENQQAVAQREAASMLERMGEHRVQS